MVYHFSFLIAICSLVYGVLIVSIEIILILINVQYYFALQYLWDVELYFEY